MKANWRFKPFDSLRAGVIAAAIVAACSISPPLFAAETVYPSAPSPGGLSPTPDVTSMGFTNGQASVQWNGWGGPYVLEGKADLASPWQEIGTTEEKWLKFAADHPSAFYHVKAPAPVYAGADAGNCVDCHADQHAGWTQTRHAGALDTLASINMATNPECLKCHTVASGIETGFKSAAETPHFAGVQCENCHGPASRHSNDPYNLAVRPVTVESANLCGGCHSDFHHPTLENWETALHAEVNEHVAGYFLDPNTATGISRMNSCGACHSGAVRSAMLKAAVKGTDVKLPTPKEAAETGITCVVCHDPHKPNVDGGASLRFPNASQAFYSYNTSTNFASQYNPNVQTCGQCHNQRGASYKDTSRPPHHSPQYNVLIGDIGDGLTAVSGPHTKFTSQCVTCHMHASSPATPTAENPVDTGHTFQANTEACVTCHQSSANADTKIATTQADIKARIQEVKGLLDQWGETIAPEVLRTKYGKLAWEYNSVGQVSNPTGAAGIVGPTSTEQTNVVAEIKKARMYLYMVEHDGSYGVHNGKYARFLLNTAKTNVVNLLNAP